MKRVTMLIISLTLIPISRPIEAAVQPRPAGITVEDDTGPRSPGVEAAGSESRYETDLDRASFDAVVAAQAAEGRQLVDVEVRWDGTEERYSAVFFPLPGTVHTLIQGTADDWNDFVAAMQPLDGRYLDVEVGFFGPLDSLFRYSAIFYEDGDDYAYALRTVNTESEFQAWLDQYLREGLAIVDFEAYVGGDGDLRLAGVWVDDPNQPRTVLYYHLTDDELSDLLRPLAGRLIDFERYWSPLHGEYRYAVITAMVPGGGWAHFRWKTRSELDALHDTWSDADTHLTDLEEWESGGTLYYGALWGDTYKTLYEVDAIPADPDPEPEPGDLTALLTGFESGNQGTIGLYAKNLRTDQSFSWRPDEPFYLASAAKVAIHVKLWQEIEAMRLDPTDTLSYTECADCRNNWYVDERPNPGFNSSDFGSAFPVEQFDRAMMQVSDNGATSALVDDETYGVSHDDLDLNEWLSGLSGIGRGWGPVTSIHDVDRTILWQGQVTAYPSDTSYFTIPGWAFEPRFRTGSDTWGDLADYLGDPPFLPRYLSGIGYERYYAMGLNSSTPNAFVALLEALWEQRLLGPAATTDAITRMTGATPLDNLLPSYVNAWAKSGRKGGDSDPRASTAILEYGPDAIAIAVLTKDNARTSSSIDTNFMAPIALEAFEGLAVNLAPDDTTAEVSDEFAVLGEPFEISVDVPNLGGGDCASAWDLTFYASRDTIIGSNDDEIGTARVPGCQGYGTIPVTWSGSIPEDIPPDDYWITWIADTASTTSLGEIGEWDESDNEGLFYHHKVAIALDGPGDELWVDGWGSPGVDRHHPRVAMDGLRRSIVVWEAFNADGGDRNDVFMRRFENDGGPMGPPLMVNTTTAEDQRYPVVATQHDGDFLVAWQSEEPTAEGTEEVVRARLFNDDGTPAGDELVLNETPVRDTTRISVDVAASPLTGDFVVVWDGFVDAGLTRKKTIRARLVSATGVLQGGELQLNLEQDDEWEYRPSVAYAPDGRFTAVWQSVNAIESRRFAADGSPLSGELFVTQGGPFNDPFRTPAVSIGPSGQTMYSWKSTGDLLVARLYTAAGEPMGPDFYVGSSPVHDVTYPHGSSAISDGTFVLAWETQYPEDDDPDRGIDARVVTGQQEFLGPTMQVNQYTPDTQQVPAVAARSDLMMFVWKSHNSPRSLHDDVIQGRLLAVEDFDPAVIHLGSFETGDLSGWSAVRP